MCTFELYGSTSLHFLAIHVCVCVAIRSHALFEKLTQLKNPIYLHSLKNENALLFSVVPILERNFLATLFGSVSLSPLSSSSSLFLSPFFTVSSVSSSVLSRSLLRSLHKLSFASVSMLADRSLAHNSCVCLRFFFSFLAHYTAILFCARERIHKHSHNVHIHIRCNRRTATELHQLENVMNTHI